MMHRLLAALVLLFALAGSALASTFYWGNATSNNEARDQLTALVMAEHDRYCAPYTNDNQLKSVALYKAQDMGYRASMTHTTVDGHSMAYFLTQAGVPWSGGWGENIAWNNYPDDQSAQVAFNGWMNSPGHRDLIRNCNYTHLGIGVFQTKGGGGDGSKWYAAEFTRP